MTVQPNPPATLLIPLITRHLNQNNSLIGFSFSINLSLPFSYLGLILLYFVKKRRLFCVCVEKYEKKYKVSKMIKYVVLLVTFVSSENMPFISEKKNRPFFS